MSDQTINQPRISLKTLNARLRKLNRVADTLDMLLHQQKRLAKCYREISHQCAQLSENIDHLDVVVFELRQELSQLQNLCNPCFG